MALFDKSILAIARVMREWPRAAGQEMLNQVSDNFKAQGYDGGEEKWAGRKDGNTKRALLVGAKTKTSAGGALRRSFKVIRIATGEVTVGSQVPYAVYHQTGTPNMPARKLLGASPKMTERLKEKLALMLKNALR
jgi:phage gpG-like protein